MKLIIDGKEWWVHPEITLKQLTKMINFRYPGKVLRVVFND